MSVDPVLPLARAAREMHELQLSLRERLEDSAHPDVQALAARLQPLDPSAAVTLVVVGQHDAGKSSLLRCLTGRHDIAVGAGPTTDRQARYEWDGHVLIDTPGVLAGVDASHDAVSWQALAAADVVVFVTTLEGLDDPVVDYFQQVCARLRSHRSLVFVVNKALSERSDRAVVAEDLLEGLGSAAEGLPLVWTDAKRWLEADSRDDPDAARAESGVQDLADHLTGTARNSGAHLRLLAVLRGWGEVGQDALHVMAAASGMADEPVLAELDGLVEALAKQRDAGRQQVQERADAAVAALHADLLRAGPDVDEPTLTDAVQRAFDVFSAGVTEDGAQRDAALEVWQAPVAVGAELAPRGGVDVVALVQRSLTQVAKTFGGAGARPGGAGHTMVYKTWKAMGGRFRPHQAVNTSKTIGKVAGRANIAFTVGLAGWELLQARREAKAADARAFALADWRSGSRTLAEDIVQPWREQEVRLVDTLHDEREREVARQRLTVLSRLADRDEEAAALLELVARLDGLASRLDEGLARLQQ